MTITVKIIEDSVSKEGKRLTTFQLYYPRFIHSEVMTHKSFSRSASSSRAMPVKLIIRAILDDPATPVEWGSNQRGMQAGVALQGWRLWLVKTAWHIGKHLAVLTARVATLSGAHKQVINRILEPYAHINVVLTATEYTNFFKLRCHKDADPTFQELAKLIRGKKTTSTPRVLQAGKWHLPYVTDKERAIYDNADLCIMSAARCARVSYNKHAGGAADFKNDLRLFNQLMGGEIKHASPTEHQAKPDTKTSAGHWRAPDKHGNLVGWCQARKYLKGEFIQG